MNIQTDIRTQYVYTPGYDYSVGVILRSFYLHISQARKEKAKHKLSFMYKMKDNCTRYHYIRIIK